MGAVSAASPEDGSAGDASLRPADCRVRVVWWLVQANSGQRRFREWVIGTVSARLVHRSRVSISVHAGHPAGAVSPTASRGRGASAGLGHDLARVGRSGRQSAR